MPPDNAVLTSFPPAYHFLSSLAQSVAQQAAAAAAAQSGPAIIAQAFGNPNAALVHEPARFGSSFATFIGGSLQEAAAGTGRAEEEEGVREDELEGEDEASWEEGDGCDGAVPPR